MRLLAVDPGLRYPAYALFEDGVLVRATRVKVPGKLHDEPLGTRMLTIARMIVAESGLNVNEVVTEWPRCYNKMKGDPADLFPLAGIGMCVAGLLDVPVSTPTAPEWIGNLPKTTKGDSLGSIRGHRIWSRLSDDEKSVVVLSHDSVDAVGLGLWKLGRLDRRMAIVGANRQPEP